MAPRKTRAAARAEAAETTIHEDEISNSIEDIVSSSSPSNQESLIAATQVPLPSTPAIVRTLRQPLSEIALNWEEQRAELGRTQDNLKSGSVQLTVAGTLRGGGHKSKKENKKKRAKRGMVKRIEQQLNSLSDCDQVVADEHVATASQASDDAIEIMRTSTGDGLVTAEHSGNERTTSPAAELARLSLYDLHLASKTNSAVGTGSKEEVMPSVLNISEPSEVDVRYDQELPQTSCAVQKLEALFAMPRVVDHSDIKIDFGIVETAASSIGAQPAAYPRTDAIKDLHALEDDLEEIENALPETGGRSSPNKSSPGIKKAGKSTNVLKTKKSSQAVKPATKLQVKVDIKPAPMVSAMTATTQRFPMARAQANSSSVRQVASAAVPKPALERTKRHSKIVALNTPPRVAKSTKPPTKSTFQLPGEAKAAELKRQREERKARQETELLKKQQAPKIKHTVSLVPAAARAGTTASRARTSVISGTTPDKASKRVSTYASARSAAACPPRASLFSRSTVVKSAFDAGKQSSLFTLQRAPRPSSFVASSTQSTQAFTIKQRPSSFALVTKAPLSDIVSANAAKPRTVVAGTSGLGSVAPNFRKSSDASGAARNEKLETQKLGYDRLEAIRKARAEAAERGRATSRAWAEKKLAESIKGKDKAKDCENVSGVKSIELDVNPIALGV